MPILVVDDDAAKRVALKSILLSLRYSIVEANSGVAALRCVMAEDFAVIVLDVRMPGMNGFETAAAIRERPASELTPIIFITADNRDEISGASVYAAGGVGFMCGAVDPGELRSRVAVFANQFARARELAAAASVVQESADRLRLLTEAAPIGIFRTDADNRYVYTNPRWSEITGVSADEVQGTELGSRLSLGTSGGTKVELVNADSDGDEATLRIVISVPEAPPRVVVATSRPIPSQDGAFAGRVGTLADVTAEVVAEAALSNARDRANDASRLKSDFLANMSHEIRTPMNGVIGMTDLLLETALDPTQRDYAQTVRKSGEALLVIVNDILDFSKIEAGMLEVQAVDFRLRTIVEGVVTLLRSSAATKQLDLRVVMDEAVPLVVRGDPGRVRQVLTNLLANAIKFTTEGHVILRVSEDAGLLRFEIEDTGDGIAADRLRTVFEPFVQEDTSTSRRYGGSGLGLAISSELVRRMGGACGVSSQPHVGSTFWFTVRVHEATTQVGQSLPEHAVARGEAPIPGSELSGSSMGRRLLLAEDNLVNQKVAVAMLAGAGYIVDVVKDGEEAVRAFREVEYDLILMDCQMPAMNGYEATEAIRLIEGATHRTPIIAMTAGARPEDRERCLAAGMDAYVSKPITKDGFLAVVAQWTACEGRDGPQRGLPPVADRLAGTSDADGPWL